MADEEGFVRRWSRRKSAAREQAHGAAREPVPGPEPEGAAAAPAPAAAEAPAGREPEPAVDLDSLPDIDSLTYESDYTVFLRKGVPPELRKRALARLWRSDPVFANLDGLVEYGEDYSKIGTVKQVVRTAYRVGRGMLERLEPEPTPASPEPDIETAAGRSEGPDTEPPALVADTEPPALVTDADRATPSGVPVTPAAVAPEHGQESPRSSAPRRLPKRG